jgi:hypothetical protein
VLLGWIEMLMQWPTTGSDVELWCLDSANQGDHSFKKSLAHDITWQLTAPRFSLLSNNRYTSKSHMKTLFLNPT